MEPIYSERESKNLEFKSKLPSFQQLVKTCVAFANGTGGRIVLGVDDKTRALMGVDEATRDRLYEGFPNSVYDATSPSLLVEIYERNVEGVNLMLIEVPTSMKKPVFVKREGIPEGVYVRVGPNTRRASADSIEELMRENKRVYFDEEPIQEDPSLLSSALVKNIFGNVTEQRLVAEKVLTPAPAATQKYYPTVAGTLAFCESPERHLPEALIQCTRFQGLEGRNIIQTEEISGSIENQITLSFQLIRSWLLRNYHLSDAKLQATSLIPEEALREAITNAVLHRKYSIPGAVKIALYDNRLEIFSPGNFPGLVDVNRLGDGTTYLRNPHLVRLARRFGLIEKLGTGIRVIFESCKKAGLKKPEFIESADSVKVIFYFLPDPEKCEAEEKKLLALFKLRETVKLEDIQTFLKVSRNTATRRLNDLLHAGYIQRLGKGPSVRYVLS